MSAFNIRILLNTHALMDVIFKLLLAHYIIIYVFIELNVNEKKQ